MSVQDVLKQTRPVTYQGAWHTQDYVNGFKINYKVFKSFLKRIIVLDVRTLYHGAENYQPYMAKFQFCAGELGKYNPARFDYAKFSYDRFSSGVFETQENWQLSRESEHILRIDMSDFSQQPLLRQPLFEVNRWGMLPSLDLSEPNVVVMSDTKGLLIPSMRLNGEEVQFELNIDPFEPVDWYYNSALTVYVKCENVVWVDGERESMIVGDKRVIGLGITREELVYMQIKNCQHKAELTIEL